MKQILESLVSGSIGQSLLVLGDKALANRLQRAQRLGEELFEHVEQDPAEQAYVNAAVQDVKRDQGFVNIPAASPADGIIGRYHQNGGSEQLPQNDTFVAALGFAILAAWLLIFALL